MPAPVISVAQMREWEKASWAAGITEAAVMGRVGELVARRALQMTRPDDLILILAGKGHNGDDARLTKEHLPNRRVEVQLAPDPAKALAGFNSALEGKPALIVDGLFGIGLNRPLDNRWVALINRINESRTPVLAVDVPSGLNAESGQTEGAAIEASVTLTLGAPKRGLLEPAAGPHVGRLEVAPEIGLIPCPLQSEKWWTLASDFRGFPPARPAAGNKGDFGRLAIVAGSLGYHGAAVLTARGAQRAQPGLITLHTQAVEAVYQAVASQLQAVMVSMWRPELELPGGFDGVLVGPGLAAASLPEEIKEMTQKLWRESATPVVIDASALDWLPHGPVKENSVRAITPHPGEAARLLGTSTAQVQADRTAALREISRRLGDCWVALKGQQTLIGRSTGPIYINSSGNPHLAQGGSGDLLAGFLAGLLAQPALRKDPLMCLRHAVWQHGAAADRLTASRKNWVVEDLAAVLGDCAESGGGWAG